MRTKEKIKKSIAWLLCKMGVDALWRYFNQDQLLIVTYHGLYSKFNRKSLPLFTHLHVDLFREHLKLYKKYYHVVSLAELENCVREGSPWPEKSLLITFDDGFKNNYEVAFPVLKEFELPAAVFLTVDYIGSDQLLWFDELFVLLKQCLESEISRDLIADCIGWRPDSRNVEEQYPKCANRFKRKSVIERKGRMARLKKLLHEDESSELLEHFRMLSWEQVLEMKSSGLVQFGVHTATHRIVSNLSGEEWEKEIVIPKGKMEGILKCSIDTFCYPNGIIGVDFLSEHEAYLEENGYVCAFCTNENLNMSETNLYRLGRVSVGSGITSDIHYLRLKTAGVIKWLKSKY